MLDKTNKDTMRLNINVNKELIKKVDEYACKMNINRTSAVSVLLSISLEQEFNYITKSKE